MAGVIVKAVWQALVNIKESLMKDKKNQTETSNQTTILSEETKIKPNTEKYESPEFCEIILSLFVIVMVIFIMINIWKQLLNSEQSDIRLDEHVNNTIGIDPDRTKGAAVDPSQRQTIASEASGSKENGVTLASIQVGTSADLTRHQQVIETSDYDEVSPVAAADAAAAAEPGNTKNQLSHGCNNFHTDAVTKTTQTETRNVTSISETVRDDLPGSHANLDLTPLKLTCVVIVDQIRQPRKKEQKTTQDNNTENTSRKLVQIYSHQINNINAADHEIGSINEESDTDQPSVNSSSPQPLGFTHQPCLSPRQLHLNKKSNQKCLNCGRSSQLNCDQMAQRGRPCTTSRANNGLILSKYTTPWPHHAHTSDARNKLDAVDKRLRPSTRTFIGSCGSVRGRGVSSVKTPALHPLSTVGTVPRYKRRSPPLKNSVGVATSRSNYADDLGTILETDHEC